MTISFGQRGVALIVGLLLLLIMTLLGVSAMQNIVLEERMSAAASDGNLAFQAAEATLRDAEQFLKSEAETNNPFNPLKRNGGPFAQADNPVCTNGLCQRSSAGTDSKPWASYNDSDWNTYGLTLGAKTGAASLGYVSMPPHYLIELLGTAEDSKDSSRCYGTFRLTVRSWGAVNTTAVQLQEIYRLRAKSCAS